MTPTFFDLLEAITLEAYYQRGGGYFLKTEILQPVVRKFIDKLHHIEVK